MKIARHDLRAAQRPLAVIVNEVLPPHDTGFGPLPADVFAAIAARVEECMPAEADWLTTRHLRDVVDAVREARHHALVRDEQERQAVLPRREIPCELWDACYPWSPVQMLASYEATLAAVRGALGIVGERVKADPHNLQAAGDAGLWHGMERDVAWTVRYIATGDAAPPVDRVRVVPVDPADLAEWIEAKQAERLGQGGDDHRPALSAALEQLSDRELEAYLLVKGEGFSWAQAAQVMGCSKSSVQTHLERASEKIGQAKVSMSCEMTY